MRIKNLLPFVLLIVVSCERNDEKLQQIYFNSFENRGDVLEWQNFGGAYYLSGDVPEGGGDSSLFVSGGCTVPHVIFEYGILNEAGSVMFRCWGKSIPGGEVCLMKKNDCRSSITTYIRDSIWTFHESDTVLECSEKDTLIVTLSSGGIKPGGMFIDNFKLLKTDQ